MQRLRPSQILQIRRPTLSPSSEASTCPRAHRSAVVYFPHMAAKKITLNELGDMLTHVVKHMATKDDIARLDIRIDKLDSKIDRLDTKLTKFEENEIDKRLQLEVRVSHIEKHLGIDKKIAA
jgi:hypothetical protein